MYINVQAIITVSSLLAALGAIFSAIISVYRQIDLNRKQTKLIESMQAEQQIICRGVRGALQGLIEMGCDGECREALAELNSHLNSKAHTSDLS